MALNLSWKKQNKLQQNYELGEEFDFFDQESCELVKLRKTEFKTNTNHNACAPKCYLRKFNDADTIEKAGYTPVKQRMKENCLQCAMLDCQGTRHVKNKNGLYWDYYSSYFEKVSSEAVEQENTTGEEE